MRGGEGISESKGLLYISGWLSLGHREMEYPLNRYRPHCHSNTLKSALSSFISLFPDNQPVSVRYVHSYVPVSVGPGFVATCICGSRFCSYVYLWVQVL